MARRSNKSVAATLTAAATTAKDNDEDLETQRKITLATEGFTTDKFCELILRAELQSLLESQSSLRI